MGWWLHNCDGRRSCLFPSNPQTFSSTLDTLSSEIGLPHGGTDLVRPLRNLPETGAPVHHDQRCSTDRRLSRELFRDAGMEPDDRISGHSYIQRSPRTGISSGDTADAYIRGPRAGEMRGLKIRFSTKTHVHPARASARVCQSRPSAHRSTPSFRIKMTFAGQRPTSSAPPRKTEYPSQSSNKLQDASRTVRSEPAGAGVRD